ncbi:MAG TPA: META domain-containing protein [Hanamia sp.]|jgi:heat shock protein HslJ|nr:META domain-containing protein [Hanamia sp.]
MKIRFEIIIAALIGFGAICMNCNPSKKINKDAAGVETQKIPLQETHWTLVELMGTPIADTPERKEMYLVLHKDQNRVEGNGGCNAFSATYVLKNNEISFSPLVSTKVFCPALKYENDFFKALSTANHFYIKGDTLSLTEGKILRVAKFIGKM